MIQKSMEVQFWKKKVYWSDLSEANTQESLGEVYEKIMLVTGYNIDDMNYDFCDATRRQFRLHWLAFKIS